MGGERFSCWQVARPEHLKSLALPPGISASLRGRLQPGQLPVGEHFMQLDCAYGSSDRQQLAAREKHDAGRLVSFTLDGKSISDDSGEPVFGDGPSDGPI